MNPVLLFVVMVGTSYRLWRIIGADEWPPSKWFRARLAALPIIYRDAAARIFVQGASDAHARKVYERRAAWLAEAHTMIECPWCLGAWVSFAVVSITTLWTSVPLPILQAGAVSCAVGLIGTVVDG